MLLFFLNSPYREDSASAQYVGCSERLDSPDILEALGNFILEASPTYSYGWLDVFDTSSRKWYSGCLNFDYCYEEIGDRYTVDLTSFKPRDNSAVFFRNFTLEQGNNNMITGNAQEVVQDALGRMERITTTLTTVQNAQIAAQKAATEAAKAIEAVGQIQGDMVFLQNLLQQFSGAFGTLNASATGPTEEGNPVLPPVNTDPDPRLPSRGTARALLGQEPEAPSTFRRPPASTPATQAPQQRTLPASPALEGLAEAAGRMVGELVHHRRAVQAEQAANPQRRGGPTEEAPSTRTNPGATEDNHQYIGHFAGPHSLFVRFLHPEVTTGGRGFIKPGYADLKQYKQDVTQIAAPVLMQEDWPTGFYRNAQSGTRQLMLRLPSALVLIDNPMMPNNMPLVAFSQDPSAQWRQIRTLTVEELNVLHDEIRALFEQLEQQDKAL